jgi:hypothetical protein
LGTREGLIVVEDHFVVNVISPQAAGFPHVFIGRESLVGIYFLEQVGAPDARRLGAK